MQLDHGLLNLPLSKRGDIDQQIDAFKAREVVAAKKARKQNAERVAIERLLAKALVEKTTDAEWQRLSQKTSQPLVAVKKYVTSQAHWQPGFVIRLLGQVEA
jgi:Ni/Co efflux regulator RcnB